MTSNILRRLWLNSIAQRLQRQTPRRRFVPRLLPLEDRVAPATTISIADSSITEPAGTGSTNMDFTVTRSGFLNSQITVGYTTVAGTAQANTDFTPQTGTVTFPPLSTTQHILIPIHGNNVFDTPDLTFSVQLTGITDVIGTPVTFSGPTQFAVSEEANYAAAGDINGDGKPDLVVSNENFGPSNGTSVSVLLNTTPNGGATPTFASRVDFTVGTHPTVVGIADFNQDGKLDVAVANNTTSNVSLLRNTTATGAGTPTFAAQQTLAAAASLVHLAVGDFNNDGKPDLIVCDRDANSVTVWINTTTAGSSTFSFAAPVAFPTGTKARWAAVGDLNNDGKQDVVVANFSASTLTILRNTTTVGGTTPSFDVQGPFSIGASSGPRSVTLADINGDGTRDVLVATETTDRLSVRLNTTANGATTISLAATVTFTTGDLPRSVAAVDFNNDGRPDVVAGNYNDGTISAFRNDTLAGAGAASLVGQGTFSAVSRPNSIEAADFNGDGKLDIVSPNHNNANATVLLNTSDVPTIADGVATGTIIEFGSPPQVQFSVAGETLEETAGAFSITVTLSAASGSDVSVPFTLGGTAVAGVDYTGVTPSPLVIPAGQTSGTISGTLIDDGPPDTVDKTLTFTLGAPTGGTLGATTTNTLTIIEPIGTLLYATGADAGGGPHVKVFNPNGSLRFGFFAYGAGFTGGVRVATADVDGDGVQDIITAAGAGGGPHVKVFSGVDAHLLASFFAYTPSFNGGVYVAAGDVNSDGKAEIFTGAGAGGHVKVIDGTKLGQIQANSQISDGALLASFFAYSPSFAGGVRVAAGDVNGDGKADLITAPGAGGGPHVRVFSAGNPGVVLREFMAFNIAYSGGVFVAAGDLDGDFNADIVAGQGTGLGAAVRTFSGATGSQTNELIPFPNNLFTGADGVRVAVEDRDGDRKKDIIAGTGPSAPSKVRIFKGTTLVLLDEFAPYDNFPGGVFVG